MESASMVRVHWFSSSHIRVPVSLSLLHGTALEVGYVIVLSYYRYDIMSLN
ncbi:TMhelix containing protein [Vibrio phage 1.031.O._10N.261.46.F8]|nr:TMhelix containing protein [Vibrio phage 1.031.O._10N.261.46.F8]